MKVAVNKYHYYKLITYAINTHKERLFGTKNLNINQYANGDLQWLSSGSLSRCRKNKLFGFLVLDMQNVDYMPFTTSLNNDNNRYIFRFN